MDPWNFRAPIYDRVRRLWPISLILGREKKNIQFLLSQVELCSGVALDVGCGSGNGIEMIKVRLSVVGIDRSRRMAAIAHRAHHAPVIIGVAEHLPMKPAAIDLFLVIGLIEYLQNPTWLFQQLTTIGKSRCFVLATSSPLNIFAFLRRLTGIRLWPRKETEIISMAERQHFTLVERRSCWTQEAFLFTRSF